MRVLDQARRIRLLGRSERGYAQSLCDLSQLLNPFAGHDVPDSRRAPHVVRRKAARHGEAVGPITFI